MANGVAATVSNGNGSQQIPVWAKSIAWALAFILTVIGLSFTVYAAINNRIDCVQKEMEKKIETRDDKLIASIERLRIDMYSEFKDLRKEMKDRDKDK